MTGKDDLAVDMEKGSDQDEREQPQDTAKTPGPPVNKRRLWRAIAALVIMGIAIFVIAFPISYLHEDDESEELSNITEEEKDITKEEKDITEEEKDKETAKYVASSSPFKVQLAMISEDITRGYKDSADIEEDLGNVARFLLNNVLHRNTGKQGYEHVGMGRRNPNVFMTWEDVAVAAPVPAAADVAESAPQQDKVADDFDDYGSNNQEEGVEEGDMIVSDGENGKQFRISLEAIENQPCLTRDTHRALSYSLHGIWR
jgi:hypothetical protein